MTSLTQAIRRKDRGFTLIELLVVIAIIAVLAALILAALSSAQKGARDSRRKSDLNQYKTALAQYAADNGGAYVAGTNVAMTGATTEPYATLSVNSKYMKSGNAVIDPKNASPYRYIYTGTTTDFGMCAPLERDTTKEAAVGPTFSGDVNVETVDTCAVKG